MINSIKEHSQPEKQPEKQIRREGGVFSATDKRGVAVVNFGGQYAHLIAKRIRHLGAYAFVVSPQAPLESLATATGVILSGGPSSVLAEGAPQLNPLFWETELPILGLCYGHQLLAWHYGGEVRCLAGGEYGKAKVELKADHALFAGVIASRERARQLEVWMSHQDTVMQAPAGFQVLASTDQCPVVAMANDAQARFGLQFHPEVRDTPQGERILDNFLSLTKTERNWSLSGMLKQLLEQSVQKVGTRNVLMFLSGGVDSTVAFALLTKALGTGRVHGVFVDNGFMRLHEAEQVRASYAALGWQNVSYVDASAGFLQAIKGITDPQQKRLAVGNQFLQVRENLLQEMGMRHDQWMLGQGTLYPDIIESGGAEHAAVIKLHHNRVDAVTKMIKAGLVIEPLADLYKDEVRQLGDLLGLPPELVWRQPFPGPGLSINVICAEGATVPTGIALTEQGLKKMDLSGYRASVLPVLSVGVQGDARTYAPPVLLSGKPDWHALANLATKLTNGLPSVNRVVYLLAPCQFPELLLHQGYCDKQRLDLLRKADHMVTEAFAQAGWLEKIFQLLVILLPLGQTMQSETLVIRPVISEDVMTARFAEPPWQLLTAIANELIKLPAIEAILYDVTHKPPATFAWE